MENIELALPSSKKITIKSGIDRYGFSNVLAGKLGIRIVPRSFADWIHGWVWHEAPTAKLLMVSNLPRDVTVIVRNSDERQALIDENFRDVRVGGLPFAYVSRQCEMRLNGYLLAIPGHSTESEKMVENQFNYIDYLESIKRDFEAIYMSIHYLDWGTEMHKAALDRGLRVLQGARPDDANSLLRTRAMFDLFETVTSNVMGSHVLYSLFSNCKFSFSGPMFGYNEATYLGNGNPNRHTANDVEAILELHSTAYLKQNFPRFFKNHPRHGQQDYLYAAKAIGLDNILNSDAIKDAIGWTVSGQLKGYTSGLARKMARTLYYFK